VTPRLALIAAVAANGIIGRDNDMPWRLPTDLRHFKQVTMGKPVIMGRRTFESIGRALPGRLNIVVTRNTDYTDEAVKVAYSLDEAEMIAEAHARVHGADEVFVIGGSQLYGEAIGRADKLYITEVHARPEGDTHFPAIEPTLWREVSRDGPHRTEADSAAVSFVIYERTE
jgi:dihydrofolate reductase